MLKKHLKRRTILSRMRCYTKNLGRSGRKFSNTSGSSLKRPATTLDLNAPSLIGSSTIAPFGANPAKAPIQECSNRDEGGRHTFSMRLSQTTSLYALIIMSKRHQHNDATANSQTNTSSKLLTPGPRELVSMSRLDLGAAILESHSTI